MKSPSIGACRITLSVIGRLVLCVMVCLLGACVCTFGTSKPPVLPSSNDTDASVAKQDNDRISQQANSIKVPAQALIAGEVDDQSVEPASETGALTRRVLNERATDFNPYVITAHKQNFVIPFSYTTDINEAVYQQNDVPLREGLRSTEVKFQISLKTRLNENDLLFAEDSLALGLTLDAWWQLYSNDLSSPFRETNYAPEVFYLVPLLWGPFGGNTALMTGLEHQSNGQVQGLSRSWNRLYAALIYEPGNFVASVRPWYRLPENAKNNPEDAKGDDNPDILDFMGHGELTAGWRNSDYEYAVMLRGNPGTGKGAIEVGFTFPLFARFRGFVQLFNGYGDSLIDYDHFQTRIGLGVALTNLY